MMALVSPLLVVVGSNLTIAGNNGTIKYFFLLVGPPMGIEVSESPS